MASSPANAASESDVTPVAEETLRFDDYTLKGEMKHEKVNSIQMFNFERGS